MIERGFEKDLSFIHNSHFTIYNDKLTGIEFGDSVIQSYDAVKESWIEINPARRGEFYTDIYSNIFTIKGKDTMSKNLLIVMPGGGWNSFSLPVYLHRKMKKNYNKGSFIFVQFFFTFISDDGSWIYLREYNKLTIVDRIMNYGPICYELTKIIGLPPIIRSLDGEFLVIPTKLESELSPSLLYWCKDLTSCSQGTFILLSRL